jgi:hypothetical protein
MGWNRFRFTTLATSMKPRSWVQPGVSAVAFTSDGRDLLPANINGTVYVVLDPSPATTKL